MPWAGFRLAVTLLTAIPLPGGKAGGPPVPTQNEETDLTELEKGFVTLTPLHYDLTKHAMMKPMQKWDWGALR
jgi:hypothetical protein